MDKQTDGYKNISSLVEVINEKFVSLIPSKTYFIKNSIDCYTLLNVEQLYCVCALAEICLWHIQMYSIYTLCPKKRPSFYSLNNSVKKFTNFYDFLCVKNKKVDVFWDTVYMCSVCSALVPVEK